MTGADTSAEERVLKTFLELVRIDSPSREEAACAAYCEKALSDAGCSVRFDSSADETGSDTGNLIAELPGTTTGVLILSAHLDTVEPGRGIDPVVHEGTIVSAGDTVLGADDKAGLAAAIECVRRLAAEGGAFPTVRCVFTVQEEVGLKGAKALSPADVTGDLCLVLDADGEVGGIVTAAPTHYTFTATFEGKAAHAGVAPEKGISAVAMAAEAVTRLPIGRLDERTTANVGTINGGSATNVIAAQATLTGECRSLDRDRVDSLRYGMDDTMRQVALTHGGPVSIEWALEYEAFEIEHDAPVVAVVSSACEELGLTPRTFKTGGGSDANIISALGVPTLALSCGMKGVHSTSEQVEVADLERLASLCTSIARRMGAGTSR